MRGALGLGVVVLFFGLVIWASFANDASEQDAIRSMYVCADIGRSMHEGESESWWLDSCSFDFEGDQMTEGSVVAYSYLGVSSMAAQCRRYSGCGSSACWSTHSLACQSVRA